MVNTTSADKENTNFEENRKNILTVNNFEKIKTEDVDGGFEGNLEEVFNSDKDTEEIIEVGNTEIIDEATPEDNEIIDEDDVEELKTTQTLLEGGDRNIDDNIQYNIDYILDDDEKLINPETVYKNVDNYINNYNSIEMEKYKKTFKQVYQTYSNKNYIISMINHKMTSKIIVTKNDKTKKIVKELIKPQYLFYDDDNNLLKLKKNISNSRTELMYNYEKLIARLDIKPEEKKEFEKERKNFIELLETYYTYTLYHKRINKIITTNKSKLVLQKEMSIYNENNDYESKILNSNIYSIDNNIIDTINKQNSESLVQFNNIILTLSGKKEKDISKDKKTLETIKLYLKQKQDIDTFSKTLLNNTDIQDNYINYIILELP